MTTKLKRLSLPWTGITRLLQTPGEKKQTNKKTCATYDKKDQKRTYTLPKGKGGVVSSRYSFFISQITSRLVINFSTM